MKRIRTGVIICCLMLLPAATFAHTDEEQPHTPRETLEERREAIMQVREDRQEELSERQARRCEFAKNRLNAQSALADANLEYRSGVYQDVIERLNQIALRADNNDIETSEFRSVISGLSELVANYEADYGLYWAEVNNSANTACAEEGALRSVISTALSAMRTARADAQDIRDYIHGEVKPALEELKQDITVSEERQPEEAMENEEGQE